jgi:PIN domain nuclease of toxin-antitoxin system
MKLLLDTHVFLWFIAGSAKLGSSLSQAIRDPANEVYLSVASVWEAIVKQKLGKLSPTWTRGTLSAAPA